MGRQVQVIATRQGHDGTRVREPGDVFMIDSKYFDKRERDTGKKDKNDKPVIEYYDPPSWFEIAVAKPATDPVMVPASEVKGDDLT